MEEYPINLNLEGRRVLLVGGGSVACRKLDGLHRAGADITVVSPELHADSSELIAAWGIRYERRSFRPRDTDGYLLVIAAATDAANRQIAQAAHRSGALVNVADDAELSDFTLPATARRGKLLLTASTAGSLPALSRKVRERLEASFGEEYASYLELAGMLRPIIMREVGDRSLRREIFFRLADFDLISLHANAPASFRRVLEEILPAAVLTELDRSVPDLSPEGATAGCPDGAAT